MSDTDHRFDVEQRGRFTDILRLRDGQLLTLRFLMPDDGEALLSYFRSLSHASRYNRLMGAASELPPSELDKALHVGEGSRFAIVAELQIANARTVVGEARYSVDASTRTAEFGLSIADAWHGHGIGTAMMSNLECRAAALGATMLFGETLRDNAPMIALARKAGYLFVSPRVDWRQVRFEKPLRSAVDIPCESWRLATSSGWLTETAAT